MYKKVEKENPIIAYKGFDEDLSCRGFQYEIGKEYCLDGELELCVNGFHACQNPLDVFDYYSMSSSTRYAMVELWGDVDFAIDNEKLCATNIRIVKEMSIDELVEIGIMSSLPKKDLEGGNEAKATYLLHEAVFQFREDHGECQQAACPPGGAGAVVMAAGLCSSFQSSASELSRCG